MMCHRRTPRVQDRGDADLGTEVFGIGGDGEHGVRGGLEQETVDLSLVVVGDGSDLGGQREDNMEVGNLKQLGLAIFHPCKCLTALTLRAATVATTTIRYDGVGA